MSESVHGMKMGRVLKSNGLLALILSWESLKDLSIDEKVRIYVMNENKTDNDFILSVFRLNHDHNNTLLSIINNKFLYAYKLAF
jgi:hypothetical protein